MRFFLYFHVRLSSLFIHMQHRSESISFTLSTTQVYNHTHQTHWAVNWKFSLIVCTQFCFSHLQFINYVQSLFLLTVSDVGRCDIRWSTKGTEEKPKKRRKKKNFLSFSLSRYNYWFPEKEILQKAEKQEKKMEKLLKLKNMKTNHWIWVNEIAYSPIIYHQFNTFSRNLIFGIKIQ